MTTTAARRANRPGPWPVEFPVNEDGRIAEGIPVWSRSGTYEGRTTGARRPCLSLTCPGWFITVRWETGQLLHICSEGWKYDQAAGVVRVTGGGEISARVISPPPVGTTPTPEADWMPREQLLRCTGWRTSR